MKPTPYWQSEDGAIVLYCADCRDVLPHVRDVDAVVSDPPYSNTSEASSSVSRTMRQVRETQFFEAWLREQMTLIVSSLKPDAAMWLSIDWRGAMVLDGVCARMNIREPKIGVWDKEIIGMGGVLRNSYECFAIVMLSEFERISASERDVWRHRWGQADRESDHPAEKPVDLMVHACNVICDASATVLDPYMGSGTTAVACIRTKRKFIGIERDPVHAATARDRIIRELDQPCLPFARPETHEQLSLHHDSPLASTSVGRAAIGEGRANA